jgi:hypothetical protein
MSVAMSFVVARLMTYVTQLLRHEAHRVCRHELGGTGKKSIFHLHPFGIIFLWQSQKQKLQIKTPKIF